MQSTISDKLIIASAGSGKTTYICKQALTRVNNSSSTVLLLTYTNRGKEALEENIKKYNHGILHDQIKINTWHSFLFNECIRPYQTALYEVNQLQGISYSKTHNNFNRNRKGTPERYITTEHKIDSNLLSELAIELNSRTNGKVIQRLANIYNSIFIDEIQDMAGYDINLFKQLIQSSISTIFVGDPKQTTFSTTNATKNKNLSGSSIEKAFEEEFQNNQIEKTIKNETQRFNQDISAIANTIDPTFPTIVSSLTCNYAYDGVFFLLEQDAQDYYNYFTPVLLRYDKRTKITIHHNPEHVYNFGASKGLTFDRVIILPNKVLLDYLGQKTKLNAPAKYYIAVTRPKYSICFLVKQLPKNCKFEYHPIDITINSRTIALYKLKF